MSANIVSVTAEQLGAMRSGLVALLQDAVDSGASVGFLPPVAEAEAVGYWDGVSEALRDGSRVLLVAHLHGLGLVGAAQLDLAMRANARHRAEVSKVMVHRRARRQGLGRALMQTLDGEARRRGRTTLVLDTREGDPSETLYRETGWTRAGTIPRYARSAGGALDGTAIYYKLLDPSA